jgi:hypothetical protein
MEDDSACENEPQWTTSDELEMFQDSVDLLEDANNKLREKLAEAEKVYFYPFLLGCWRKSEYKVDMDR